VKWRTTLGALRPVLPPDLAEELSAYVPDDDGEVAVLRKATADRSTPLGDREVEQYVSTRDLDRDEEIMDPKGAVLTEFRKAPQVLWGHDYSMPPIGSDRTIGSDEYGVRAITRYAQTALADDLWSLRRDGHLNTSSVGFVPLEAVEKNADGWTKLTTKLAARWGIDLTSFEKAERVHTKWLLLEHSDVSVPANINARTIRVGKEAAEQGALLRGLVTKGVVKSPVLCAALMKTAAVLSKAETFNCECIKCGFKLESEKHCADIKCPECGGQMRRAERPGPGQDSVEPAMADRAPSRSVVVFGTAPRFVQVVAPPPPEDFGKDARRCVMQLRGQLD